MSYLAQDESDCMTRIRLRRRMTHAATAAISVSSETASQTRQSGQFTKRTRSVPCAPAGRRILFDVQKRHGKSAFLRLLFRRDAV